VKILGLIDSTTVFCLAATVSIGTLNAGIANAAMPPVSANNSPTPISNAQARPPRAVASVSYLEGFFVNSDFSIDLYREGGKYYYLGTEIQNNANLKLANPTIYRTKNQHIYTWNNQGTKYRISWNTNNPDKIRLQVIDRNRIILDRSLQRQKKEDFV
jgi:hypothetical protein